MLNIIKVIEWSVEVGITVQYSSLSLFSISWCWILLHSLKSFVSNKITDMTASQLLSD